MIGFLATDDKANATMEPIVNLCDCMNGGTCLFGQYVVGTMLVQDRFGVSTLVVFSVLFMMCIWVHAGKKHTHYCLL